MHKKYQKQTKTHFINKNFRTHFINKKHNNQRKLRKANNQNPDKNEIFKLEPEESRK